MATVDEQSDPIFSDDDTSKPKNNDYNSDNSSASSDSGKRDMNVSNKSELRKVKQDINTSSAHNFSSEKGSQVKKCEPVLAQHQAEKDSDDEFIDGLMEIDFVQRKEPATDVVTVKCKIQRLVIPAGTVDPGANFPIMFEDISKRSKLEIDTKEKYDLRDIATTPTESLGIVRNVPVNFAPGYTIYANFAVVKYPKPMLILPNTLLDKYNYDLLASKRELRLECNGKEFFIPINMHKVKNKLEVNCTNITSESDASSTPDCISQDLSEDGTLKKK
ncbi:hypothetical protein RclHR1_24640003 [Rhizophagus clarus]|uniref:Uncharacterized protein n=1 Tax=Rhizophagus clarus TaxID=94130 RepID=A0A2Z6QT81_9GLOM|nr:hypothetical protein RclHR1_02040007 [Rhizophagus clarus]GBB95033.1 hypothetical protein RclHR1_24640003 [Rhizophagus clarus]